MAVQKRFVSGCEVAVVIVEPSDAPPVRFNGRCWIRVGTPRATATTAEEARLSEKRRFHDIPFDLRPVHDAALDDLDVDLFRRRYLPASVAPEVIEQNQRSLEHQMKSLRILSPGTQAVPTVLGILVCGKDPLQFLPGSYIQFLRIAGDKVTDPIKDSEVIAGPLPELLVKLDTKLESHLSVTRDFTSKATEQVFPDYPLPALQQISRNAILHRSYESTNAPIRITWLDDRIEIINPGGPYGSVNIDNFGEPGITDYRNPHLGEAMKNLGYVQKLGLGIQIAREQMAKNGNPSPKFSPQAQHVLVELQKRK